MQSIHGAGQPDWQKTLNISECLLREQSKDLRVAVWLTWALYQRESFAGLLAGLGLLRHLCEHHWSTVHPQKLRTRSAAFGWLVLRLETLLVQSLSLQDQQPLFRALLEQLSRLDELWTAHLAQARLCVHAGKHELAKILLEHLDVELQRSGLERWEPELAFQVTQLLHRCCDLMPQNHAVRERKEDTHRRLCLFDLEAVLE